MNAALAAEECLPLHTPLFPQPAREAAVPLSPVRTPEKVMREQGFKERALGHWDSVAGAAKARERLCVAEHPRPKADTPNRQGTPTIIARPTAYKLLQTATQLHS
jgi:hypothetical protein